MEGKIISICIAPEAGAPMHYVDSVRAIAGRGLEGDRYASAIGSYNQARPGARQVTFMNQRFFAGSGFTHQESRRNIAVLGVELMWLIGRMFHIGGVKFEGLKYCDPCARPGRLIGSNLSFAEAFSDRGGLVADILTDGVIRVGDVLVPPPKRY